MERPEVSIKSAPALRAFIRVAPDIVRRLGSAARRSRRLPRHRPRHRALGRGIGDLRFETDGAWKQAGRHVETLARELKLALEYPGAGV